MLRVGLLVPDGFATFSFAPLAAFEAANLVLGERFYDVHVTSVAGGRRSEVKLVNLPSPCVSFFCIAVAYLLSCYDRSGEFSPMVAWVRSTASLQLREQPLICSVTVRDGGSCSSDRNGFS